MGEAHGEVPIIDYAGPGLQPRARTERSDPVVFLMAWAWIVNGMLSGISADRVQIPEPKKLAISGSAAVIAGLLCAVAWRRWRAAVAFLIWAGMMTAVMWFWN